MVNAAAAAHNRPHFPCEHILIESTCTLDMQMDRYLNTRLVIFLRFAFFPVSFCAADRSLGAFHRETAGEWKEDLLRLALPGDTNETAIKAFRGAVSRSRTTKPEMLVRRPRYVYRRRSERDLTLSI
jgi:hypothetical protein